MSSDYGVFMIGMAVGIVLLRIIDSWPLLWRECCRRHAATHSSCGCRDCAEERKDT